MKPCPFCGKGQLERKTIAETHTYKGNSINIQQPGEYCNQCDEGILNTDDLKATEKQLHDFRAKIDGLLTSAQIRQTRRRLGLTQIQAARYFGGGVNAFSRYERGEAMQLRSVDNLLRVLDQHPELIKELRQEG